MPLPRASFLALLVLLAGLLATLLVTRAIRDDFEEEAALQAAALADEATLKLSQQLWTYGIALRGGAAFFSGSREIGRDEWRSYVETLELTEFLPGMQGIGFAEWIPAPALAAHEARLRHDGFDGYRVWPEGARAGYSAVVYLEPFSGRNLRAFGYDMFSDPVRRVAMAQARDSGIGALSGRVRLQQEDGRDEQAGFLMYAPVYRTGAPVTTVAERRAALTGWVYSPYRMKDMVAATFRGWRPGFGRSLFLTVYDGDTVAPDARMFDNTPPGVEALPGMVQQQRLLEFRGRHWLLVFHQPLLPQGFDRMAAVLAPLGGVVISGLLAGLVLVLGRTREDARRLAARMTRDLRDSQARLAELEERWKFALEGSDLGVWDWNVQTGEVWFSQRWKEMLGYEADEIGNNVGEWESRVHPDDWAAVMRDVQACFEGRVRLYLNEHRVRCKDGSYLWILDRGMVVTRDAQGRPLRMLGTHADVTHHHVARARLQRMDSLYAALSACNSVILRATGEAELFAEVCQALVGIGGIKMAWIGRIDAAAGRVRPVEAFGAGTDYLDGIVISLEGDEPQGGGPTGIAAREGHAVWSMDYADNPALAPWHERGARQGWVASGALPLRCGGQPVAVLSLYVDEQGRLDEESRALLEEFAADLSLALDRFAGEAEARAAQAAG